MPIMPIGQHFLDRAENYAEQESNGNQLSSGFTGCSEQQYTENQFFCYWDWLRCLPLFLLR